MKKITLAIALTLLTAGTALAQSCQHDSDKASDGSRCGHRSSDSRSGGR
ncbi:transmembrane anchored protein [Methylobacterium sp. WL30]|nr:transmembrane anchored protein [Methylobacterium sp. E-016]MCJ2076554.1 transmembrane anchored protein [Methylobacterium sp. E-016]TXN39947.1 transmembrane anchored protein [Methylobacterium sp. WL93]TXN46794.1 transmembrane anchored protein [Methylobacterium sp. WL119]TXN62243.1 transmembrane anchored protein [Methylobacterium sp. WL30]